jgi:hypothetical protein
MTDPGSVAAVFTSIKTAIEMVKLIRDSGTSLEKAEVQNRISDLYVALSDLKMEAADVRDAMAEKDARIAELEAALELKDTLVRHNDAYYETSDTGTPTGDAFCSRCWESDHRARHLVRADHQSNYCPTCSAVYIWDRTHPMK